MNLGPGGFLKITQRKISQREVFIQSNVVTKVFIQCNEVVSKVYCMQVEEYTESMAFIQTVD